jgi:mono/diheme cytochrome c family protein
MNHRAKIALAATLVLALGAVAGAPGQAPGQHGGHEHGASTPGAPEGAGPPKGDARHPPLRVTPEELHRQGGVPRGWKFTLPSGDPVKGRQLFTDLECYKCHAIQGEAFPAAGGDAASVGPALTGMGGMHPAEYFAESLLAPNHVIVLGPGFTGADGLSIMPSFADSLSLAQWVDLVAYLRSLTGGADRGGHAAAPGGSEVERERVAGDYRIRLVYAATRGRPEHGGTRPESRPPGRPAGGHDQHGAQHHARPGAGAAHLMAFVLDRETDEPVPYLPVTVTVHVAGAAPRSVKLGPMVGDRGFHYGADLTLPAGTERLTVGIGAAALRAMDTARGRFTKPVTAVFDWASK